MPQDEGPVLRNVGKQKGSVRSDAAAGDQHHGFESKLIRIAEPEAHLLCQAGGVGFVEIQSRDRLRADPRLRQSRQGDRNRF